MFCQKCGTELNDDAKFCSKCGTSTGAKIEPTISNSNPIFNQSSTQYQESGRGTLILILGIFSFVFGIFTGTPAWIMGSGDLKKIRNGIIPITEKAKTKIGMILGIITTLLVPFIIVFGIATVVGINVFTSSAIQANRDAIIADGTTISSMMQQHYRKPEAMGGGGNTFNGCTVPKPLVQTSNGKYTIENLHSQSLSLICVGYEIGDDGVNPIRVEILVLPESIDVKNIN